MFQSGVTGLVGSLGAVSKIVLLLLFVASILSWGVIFYKWRSFKAADREDQRFFSAFTKIRDLDELYRQSKRAEGSPSARVFQGIMDRVLTVSGDGAMTVPQPAGTSKEQVSAIDHQYMDKTVAYLVQNQVSQLESYLPVLAHHGKYHSIYRFAGHRAGDYRFIPRNRITRNGQYCGGGAGRVGGAGGDGCRTVYRDSCGHLLQLLSDAYS